MTGTTRPVATSSARSSQPVGRKRRRRHRVDAEEQPAAVGRPADEDERPGRSTRDRAVVLGDPVDGAAVHGDRLAAALVLRLRRLHGGNQARARAKRPRRLRTRQPCRRPGPCSSRARRRAPSRRARTEPRPATRHAGTSFRGARGRAQLRAGEQCQQRERDGSETHAASLFRCPPGYALSRGDHRRARNRVRHRGQAGLCSGRCSARGGAAGRVSVHPWPVPGHVSRAAVDDSPVRGVRVGGGVEPALPLSARERPDGAVGGVRPADAAGLRLRRSAVARRGGADRRGDRLAGRHGAAAGRDPAREGVDVDDDQRAGVAAPAALRVGGGGAGRACVCVAGHGAERHPEGVHRPRELHLPAAAVDAADDRSVRLLRGADPELEHDLDLGVPHPRGGLDGGAGARVHACERDRLRRRGGRGGPVAGRFRRAAVVLLQRAQRLLPGGREVPGGAARCGRGSCATGSARRTRRRRHCASTRRRAARR